jgi:hypothetical protein
LTGNDAIAANIGGVLGFGGNYHSTSYANWASIKGLKADATDSNYGGYLSFFTRLTGYSSAERMRIDTNGNIGIGTTSPYSLLSVAGQVVAQNYVATSTTATSTFAGGLTVGGGWLNYDLSTNVTSIGALQIGNMNFDTNAGMVSWADLPLSTAVASGTPEGYVAQINGNPVLTIYGQAGPSGDVAPNTRRVLIGTSTDAILGNMNIPDNSLIVGNGALCVQTGSGNTCASAVRNRGTVYAVAASVTALDLAEQYPTADTTLSPGEILMADPINPVYVSRYDASQSPSSSTPPIIGVVSTAPGFLLGGFNGDVGSAKQNVPVALTGRVPLKVNLEGGPIMIGDRLAPSSVPGVASKATATGYTIGTALERLASLPDGAISANITAFVDRTYYVMAPGGASLAVATTSMATSTATSTNSGATTTVQITSVTDSTPSSSGSQTAASTDYGSQIAVINTQITSIDSRISDLASTTSELASTTSELASAMATLTSTSSPIIASASQALASSTPFIQSLANAVQNLIQSAGNWVIARLTVTAIYASDIQTQTLEAENATVKNGIETTDAGTGGTFCIRVVNGILAATAGHCATATTTPSMTVINVSNNANTSSNPFVTTNTAIATTSPSVSTTTATSTSTGAAETASTTIQSVTGETTTVEGTIREATSTTASSTSADMGSSTPSSGATSSSTPSTPADSGSSGTASSPTTTTAPSSTPSSTPDPTNTTTTISGPTDTGAPASSDSSSAPATTPSTSTP